MPIRLEALLVGALMLSFSSPAPAQIATYDLLLRNARIIDGSGDAAYRGDVAIRGDTIVRIAPAIPEPGKRVIDVGGQVVAPGFIDVHNHARWGIFQVPTADNLVRQGVTTIIEGPDGSSPVPLAPFLKRLDALRKSLNIGSFIGQGSVREAVMGRVNRPATAAEIEQMRTLVEQGMKDGAFGLSTGLVYVPGVYSSLAEIVELAKVAGRFGGHHQSHMRSEADHVIEAVRETIAIGEQGGLPTQVTHHKLLAPANFGKSIETLRLIDAARRRGIDATVDQYPYAAVGGSIEDSMLPAWAQEGSHEDVLARLKDPEQRARIKVSASRTIRYGSTRGDLRRIALANCPWDRSLAGKTLADVALMRFNKITVETGVEAALWLIEQGGCARVLRDALNEQDVERILKYPFTMIASDGGVPVGVGTERAGVPHPRSYGTFPRVLGVYVRERKLLSLEEAVRKMTSFPAQRLKLTDRGLIREGMKADLVVLDPARVRDTATFENPHQYPDGIPIVIVNGEIAFENGAMTAARPGKVLYGPAAARANAP